MAALDFPTSPTDGDTYAGYTYNGTKGVWEWDVVTPSLASLSDTTITSATADDLLQYDGTDWVNVDVNTALGAGKILQVVSAEKTDTFTTTSTSFTDLTGLTATITPSSTGSKIYIVAFVNFGSNSSAALRARLRRDSTDILIGAAAGSRTRVSAQVLGASTDHMTQATISYVDSPGVTTAITYGLQISSNSGSTVAVNRSVADTDNALLGRGASSITVMEVAA